MAEEGGGGGQFAKKRRQKGGLIQAEGMARKGGVRGGEEAHTRHMVESSEPTEALLNDSESLCGNKKEKCVM